MACCKDHHLIFTLQTFQQFNCSRPNINACFSLLSSGKFNRDFEVMFMRYALIAVYECFIEVKYDSFFILCSFFALECEYFRFQLLLTGHFWILQSFEDLQTLGEVFACCWLCLSVVLHHLRHIVGRTSRRVRIHYCFPDTLTFGYLAH